MFVCISSCVTKSGLVWDSQVGNAIPLGARAHLLAFQHNKNRSDKASWFTQVEGLFQRGMEKEWVRWLMLIIIYLFWEISYLYRVCLVWINLGRHRMTVHNLTLTWVTGLWQRQEDIDRYCLKKGISHNPAAAQVALGNRSGLGNAGWRWQREQGEKIWTVVGKLGKQRSEVDQGYRHLLLMSFVLEWQCLYRAELEDRKRETIAQSCCIVRPMSSFLSPRLTQLIIM